MTLLNPLPVVNPVFLAKEAFDQSNPRVRIRHAKLDLHFGVGKWEETFVDLILGGGTVRVGGQFFDWWLTECSRIESVPAT